MDPTRTSPMFFGDEHRELFERASTFARNQIRPMEEASAEADEDTLALAFARVLGESGLPGYCVPAAYGGVRNQVDIRSICLIRECLGSASGFGDTMFAMQGLGSYPITLAGSEEQKKEWLPAVARAERLCAFALTEEKAGSDVVAMETTAVRKGDNYILNGEKRYISNSGVAGSYVVFAKTETSA